MTTRFDDEDSYDRRNTRNLRSRPRYDDELEPDYGTSLATLEKMYKEEYKYSGHGDNFDHKLGIFSEMCMKANVPLRH
jgi:hypothetical protein